AHTIARQLANNPTPYIPSLTQWLLPPPTQAPTPTPTTKEGPKLLHLRKLVKEFKYNPEDLLETEEQRSQTALKISLKMKSAHKSIIRSKYDSHLAGDKGSKTRNSRTLGMFLAGGATIKGKRVQMTPLQMGKVMELKNSRHWTKDKPASPNAAALRIWDKSLTKRQYVVAGVWAMMNWNDGDIFQALAEAVVEVAHQLKNSGKPVKAKMIAKRIWEDNRALEYQAVIVRAILLEKAIAVDEDPLDSDTGQDPGETTDTSPSAPRQPDPSPSDGLTHEPTSTAITAVAPARAQVPPTNGRPPQNNNSTTAAGTGLPVGPSPSPPAPDPVTQFTGWLASPVSLLLSDDLTVSQTLGAVVHFVQSRVRADMATGVPDVITYRYGIDHILQPGDESLYLGMMQALGLTHSDPDTEAEARVTPGTAAGTVEQMTALLAAARQAWWEGRRVVADDLIREVLGDDAGPELVAQARGWVYAAGLVHTTGDAFRIVAAARHLHHQGVDTAAIVRTLLNTGEPNAFQLAAVDHWLANATSTPLPTSITTTPTPTPTPGITIRDAQRFYRGLLNPTSQPSPSARLDRPQPPRGPRPTLRGSQPTTPTTPSERTTPTEPTAPAPSTAPLTSPELDRAARALYATLPTALPTLA
ncbi:hypothetical protein ACFRFD_39620, partial [Streptomyces sp. NPDC056632]